MPPKKTQGIVPKEKKKRKRTPQHYSEPDIFASDAFMPRPLEAEADEAEADDPEEEEEASHVFDIATPNKLDVVPAHMVETQMEDAQEHIWSEDDEAVPDSEPEDTLQRYHRLEEDEESHASLSLLGREGSHESQSSLQPLTQVFTQTDAPQPSPTPLQGGEPSAQGSQPLEVEHSGSSSSEEQAEQAIGTARYKQIALTRKDEAAVAEWLQQNKFLYSRTEFYYRNKDRKKMKYQEMGRKLNPPLSGDELQRFVNTRRTQFGRITKRISKSGSGAPHLTELDQWILKMFEFMRPHIKRHRETRVLGVSQVSKIL